MGNMKSNKGITLVSLIAYIILAMIVLGILGIITTNFRGNVQDMNSKTIQDVEFDKLNIQLLNETKNENNTIKASETTETKVVFTNGNKYEYIKAEKAIYMNDTIKVAQNIESCIFDIKTKQNILDSDQQYTDSNGDTAVIPAGFIVSGKESERVIQNGLVIYCGVPDSVISLKTSVKINGTERFTEYILANDGSIDWNNGTSVAEAQKTYDQFVWIPIKNVTDENAQDINDMYICQGKTSSNGVCEIKVENGIAACQTAAHKTLAEDGTTYKNTLMAGRLYVNKYGEYFEQAYIEVYTSVSGLREPDTLSDTMYGDGNNASLRYLQEILGTTGYDTEANFKESLQKEYNNIVKSVYENQGFYVGRYETSGMAQSETTYDVAVVAGTLPTVATDWYHMYAQQKNYAKANNLTVGSTMIQGAAYDQVMKFVDTEDYDVTTAGNVGHSFGSIYNTGSQSTDQSKNIFDLEGNAYTWTTGAVGLRERGCRGRLLQG